MSNKWSFHNPVQVNFGGGVRKLLVERLRNKRCLFVTTARGRQQIERDRILSNLLETNSISWVTDISSNPDVVELQGLIDKLQCNCFDVIIGFGGGSALDSAKALAVALSPDLKGVKLEDCLRNPSLHEQAVAIPLYTLPTTSGTGSEVTPFATVWNNEEKKKYSLAGINVFPRAAYVDPELTIDLPLNVSINSGLDAINQALESVWNNNATPLSISLASRSLALGLVALPKLVNSLDDLALRSEMMEASLLAGLAISQTRTALCHAISYPLTAHFGVPHGLACAFTMVAVCRWNSQADDGRFKKLEQVIGINSLQDELSQLIRVLDVNASVRSYIPNLDSILALVNEMFMPGRADNNLCKVDTGIVKDILETSWKSI